MTNNWTAAQLDTLLKESAGHVSVINDMIAPSPACEAIKVSEWNAAPKMSEHDLQAQVVAWCDGMGYPYNLIYANTNGQYRPGQRMEPGLRPGIPDLFLPHPVAPFAGLYVELKVGKNKPTANQMEWGKLLRKQGYAVEVCRDLESVQVLMGAYLAGGLPPF